ncbi:MAG: SidA/IucD/PvdA family monooxygenase [Bacteroidota bacterium]
MSTYNYDVVGVGIGPSNLSLSALLSPIEEIKSLFLDQRKSFIWHEGMLMHEASIQVSFLKDLVTLVDPSNPYSFLNFLCENKRLYRHSIARFSAIKRKEFNQYYQWATEKIPNLKFDHQVNSVRFEYDHFVVQAAGNTYRSKNLVVATGMKPFVPAFGQKWLGQQAFHTSNFLKQGAQFAGKKVMVVGGGQSGAEIVNHLLHQSEDQLPSQIDWVTRRYNYLPLDDSPFTNELYTPNYSEYFFKLPEQSKKQLLEWQRLTSDGISEYLLRSIYERLYEIEVIDRYPRMCHLHPGCELKEIKKEQGQFQIMGRVPELSKHTLFNADIIVFATGYHYTIPEFMSDLKGAFRDDCQLVSTNKDFSLNWDGPTDNKIFVQNGARNIWGVPNPNLSLNAWRSAKIINSILEKEYYTIDNESSSFDWPDMEEAPMGKKRNGQVVMVPSTQR